MREAEISMSSGQEDDTKNSGGALKETRQGSGDEGESLSTLTDSFPQMATQPRLDGGDFLAHLRAAGAFDSEIKNEDTFGVSRRRNNREDLATLSQLFEASGRLNNTDKVLHHVSSNEETIGRSNKSCYYSQ